MANAQVGLLVEPIVASSNVNGSARRSSSPSAAVQVQLSPQARSTTAASTTSRAAPLTTTSNASAAGAFSHASTCRIGAARRSGTPAGPPLGSVAALSSQSDTLRHQHQQGSPGHGNSNHNATRLPYSSSSHSNAANRSVFGSPGRDNHLHAPTASRFPYEQMFAQSTPSRKPFYPNNKPDSESSISEMITVNYEWKLSGLRKLVEELKEASKGAEQRGGFVEDEALEHEALTTCQAFGDGVWKFEMVPARDIPRNTNNNQTYIKSALPSTLQHTKQTHTSPPKGKTKVERTADELSLYLTYIPLVAAGHQNKPYPPTEAHILLALREPVQVGERRSLDTGWLWRRWESGVNLGTSGLDDDAEQSQDFWECHELPGLEKILRGSARVRAADEVSLVIQIHWSPETISMPRKAVTGPFSAIDLNGNTNLQFPNKAGGPRSLLTATASLLDDPDTSDVCIIIVPSASAARSTIHSQSEAEDAEFASLDELVLRGIRTDFAGTANEDRIIYAHSAILKARSEYFERMLCGGFAEGKQMIPQARAGGSNSHDMGAFYGKKHIIKLEDVEYCTVWALLRWIYTDEITFGDNNLAYVGMEDMLKSPPMTVASSAASDAQKDRTHSTTRAAPIAHANKTTHELRASSMDSSHAKRSNAERTPPPRAPLGRPATAPSKVSTPARPTSPSAMSSVSATSSGTRKSLLKSGRSSRDTADAAARAWRSGFQGPQEHPVNSATVESASAVAVYTLAHRYDIRELCALDHIASTLTANTVFPLLLASHVWSELYSTAKTFAFAHWNEVTVSESYPRCIQQIGDGLWTYGAKTLGDLLTETNPNLSRP